MENEKRQIEREELARKISWRISKERKDHGYTQKELAEKIGISQSTMNRYENGKIPDDYSKRALAAIFDCSVRYISGMIDNRNEITADVMEQIPFHGETIDQLKLLKAEIDCAKGLAITESDSRITAELADALVYAVIDDKSTESKNSLIIELMQKLFDSIRVTSEYDRIQLVDGQYRFGMDGMTVEEFYKFRNNPSDRYRMAKWEQDMCEQQIADILKSAIHIFAEAVILNEIPLTDDKEAQNEV